MNLNVNNFQLRRQDNAFVSEDKDVDIPIKEMRSLEIVKGTLAKTVDSIQGNLAIGFLIFSIAIIAGDLFFDLLSWKFIIYPILIFAAIMIPLDYLKERATYFFRIVTPYQTYNLKGKESEINKKKKIIDKAKNNMFKDETVELENYTIAIPAMPNNINFVLWRGLRNPLGDGSWKIEEGDWVNEGEELLNFYGRGTPTVFSSTKISIVAPVTGKIIIRGNKELCFWSRKTKSPTWNEDSAKMITIQPAKDSNVQDAVSKAYTQLTNFVDGFINEPQKLKVVSKGELKDNIWDSIIEDVEMLKTAEARVQPLTSA